MYTIDYTPEQLLAYRIVHRAKQKGLLIPPCECQTCDVSTSLCAHHWRGYQYPLDVWWVCRRCNTLIQSHDGTMSIEQERKRIADINKVRPRVIRNLVTGRKVSSYRKKTI